MIVHYRVGLYDGLGPTAVEVLESSGNISRVRELATGAIYRVRHADQLFASWDEAKSAIIDFNLLQIQFAEDKLYHARTRLREIVAMREPKHDA